MSFRDIPLTLASLVSTSTSDVSNGNGNQVDRQALPHNYIGAKPFVTFEGAEGTSAVTGNAPTIRAYLQHRDTTGGSWVDYTPHTLAKPSAATDPTPGEGMRGVGLFDSATPVLDIRGADRYLRVRYDIDFNAYPSARFTRVSAGITFVGADELP